jgi:hypothetical protein
MKQRAFLLLLLLCLVIVSFFSGCSLLSGGKAHDPSAPVKGQEDPGGEEKPEAPSPEVKTLPSIVFNPLTGRDALEAEFGSPLSSDTRERENRHDPETTDTVIQLFYRGITFTLQKSGYDGREFLMLVRIDGEHWRLPEGIAPGSSRQQVQNRFPNAAGFEEMRVETGNSRYRFLFEGEKLEAIEITPAGH